MSGTDIDKETGARDDMNDPLAELFRHASVRRQPPPEEERIVRQALYEQWRAMTPRPRNHMKFWPWAIAASIVLAIAVLLRLGPVSSPGAPVLRVAVVERLVGPLTLRTPEGDRILQEIPEGGLLSGQAVRLEKGSMLAMLWNNGSVIRVDEGTELKLVSEREVFLVTGRIYVDTSGAGLEADQIAVSTPQGLVKHLGTQFVTQVTPAGTSVRVREGRVAYFPADGGDDEQTLAERGQLLAVAADGRIAIEPIETWGAEWEWAEQLAAGFVSDGRSLADLLAWAGRESGRLVRYGSSGAETAAGAAILRGDLRDLQPMQALLVATATTDLEAEVSQGLIVIRLKSEN